jgi:hypothetical protein
MMDPPLAECFRSAFDHFYPFSIEPRAWAFLQNHARNGVASFTIRFSSEKVDYRRCVPVRNWLKQQSLTASSGLWEPVRKPGQRLSLSTVAQSLRSDTTSDGRQGPEPQAFRARAINFLGGEPTISNGARVANVTSGEIRRC